MPPSSTSMRNVPAGSRIIARESACGALLLWVLAVLQHPDGSGVDWSEQCVSDLTWLPVAIDASTRKSRPSSVVAPREFGPGGVPGPSGWLSPPTYTTFAF